MHASGIGDAESMTVVVGTKHELIVSCLVSIGG
jgi:hypothetical protein